MTRCERRSTPSTPPSASACSPSSPRAARRTPASSTTCRRAAGAAAELGIWFHVDGAYGGAALAAPSVRRRFDGIEAADSFIVDPHKWLFAPFDSCALLYREPEIARRAHTQHAEYLDILHEPDRRVRVERLGLRPPPDAPGSRPAAVVQPGDARHAGVHRRHRDHAARHPRGRRARPRGAAPRTDPRTRALRRAVPPRRLGAPPTTRRGATASWPTQQSFVTPTAWLTETVLRWCIVNPLTTVDDLAAIVDSLADDD